MEPYSEVIETRTNFRSKIVADIYPQEPDHDEGCPVLRVEYRHGYRVAFTGYGKDLIDGEGALGHFVREFGHEGIEVFERWIRIFHLGDTKSFDTKSFETREGETYIAYASSAHFESWGLSPESEYAKAHIEEWQAYVEGDVWGVVFEERGFTITERLDSEGTQISKSEEEEWQEVDSTWGYYGRTYAEETAKHELDHYEAKVA